LQINGKRCCILTCVNQDLSFHKADSVNQNLLPHSVYAFFTVK